MDFFRKPPTTTTLVAATARTPETETTQHLGRDSAHNEKNPFSATAEAGCSNAAAETEGKIVFLSFFFYYCEPPLCFHFSPRSGIENCFAHSLQDPYIVRTTTTIISPHIPPLLMRDNSVSFSPGNHFSVLFYSFLFHDKRKV